MIKILRWIAVLPAAMAGSVLAYIVVKLLSMLLNGRTHYLIGDGIFSGVTLSWQSLLGFILSNAALGFMFVYVGVYVAPDHKRITAIVLTVVLAILIGVCIAVSLLTCSWWETALAALLVMVAAVAACVDTRDEGLKLDE